MKKLITCILVMALIIPSVALANLPGAQTTVKIETPDGVIEIRDIVKILDYYNLLRLNEIVDEYLVKKSGKTAFDIKIDSMSYDELLQLKERINLAMLNSSEWQEVTVPTGVWEIGKDIPAGKWNLSVSPDSKSKLAFFTYCDRLDSSGLDAGNMFDCKIYYRGTLNRKDSDNGEYPVSLDVDFKSGTYIIIEYAPLVFSPPVGKPDLGFK